MTRKWVAAIALVGVDDVDGGGAGRENRHQQRLEGDGRRESELRSPITGRGANFGLGQSNNANGQWPRNNVSDYSRSIDFTQPASRATGVTSAAPVTGGPAVQAPFQQNITPANTAWAQQLEIWVTPWGFLKGAAANNATASAQTIGGRRYRS